MQNLAFRFVPLILGLVISACATGDNLEPEPPELTIRDRMEQEPAHLFAASERSAGSIRAERYIGDGWESGLVDLHIETGEIVLRAAGNAILVEHIGLGIAPIDVPATVIGHRAQLVDVRADLVEPVLAPAQWRGDNTEAHVSTRVQLELSWSLRIDDVTIGIGAPSLPPLPVELVVSGTGERAHAELRMRAAGEIWSWADLVRLVDLFVLVGADDVVPEDE